METPIKRHNFTLYYSNFSMFADPHSPHLLKSSIFKERLLKRLGHEWTNYASQLLFQDQEGQKVYAKAAAVFEGALSVWQANKDENEALENDSENSFEYFEGAFSQKFRIFNKNEGVYKAVLQAFFATAEQVWDSLADVLSVSRKTLKSHCKERDRMNNIKRSSMSSCNTVKPLVLISHRTREACDLKEALRRMNLNEDLAGKKEVYIKKVSKLEEQILTKLDFTKYLSIFMANSKEKWQVARCFVTNMFELNYNRIVELESKFTSTVKDFRNNVKLRVLQPAESFYQHLMKIWLMINHINRNSSSISQVSFSEYLEKVKETMGPTWSEKYVGATEVFFETLLTEWKALTMENDQTEQNLAVLIKRVREDLMQLWEEHIIRKIEDL